MPAAWLALVVLVGGSLFFRIVPDAFVACPETLFELWFYRIDQRIKAESRRPQVIVEGTSRLMPIRRVPIGPRNWKTEDQMINLSMGGNTFWHMLALHRRNPRLTERTEFAVIDLVPFQLAVNDNFTESDRLFLRESTVREKLRIHDPILRLKALADFVLPVWSERYSAASWWRALRRLGATPAQRYEILRSIPDIRLEESRQLTAAVDVAEGDDDKHRAIVAFLLYNLPTLSKVQRGALADLTASFPDSCWVLLTRAPHRRDFADSVSDESDRAKEKLLRKAAESVTSDHVFLLWMDDASAPGWTESDYSGDGFHFSNQGAKKMQVYLGETYRKLAAAHRRP
jgi:hypothetical protein